MNGNAFRKHRRASAPLELMVAMPIIVWMVAVILNAGAGGVATADATIAARTDAFRKAESHTTPQLRLFMLSAEIAGSDVVSTSATRSRAVPPALARTQLVGQSTLAVFGNVWDRRELPLNKPVHLTLMAQAGAGRGAGQLIGPAGEALNDLRSAADGGRNTVDEIGEKGKELNEESEAIKQAREQEAAQRRENAAKTEELKKQAAAEKAEIARLDGEIRAQEQAREQARKDLKDDAEALEKREAEIADKIKQLEAERTTHQQKLKRIEGEISLLEKAS